MAVRRIKPNILSERLEESRVFYRDLIGLEERPGLDWILFFSTPGEPQLQLSVMNLDVTAGVHSDVTIEVDDIEAVHERFFARDPNGAVINVMEHR